MNTKCKERVYKSFIDGNSPCPKIKSITVIGHYLLLNTSYKFTEQDIINNWNVYYKKCLSIIDRDNRKLIINSKLITKYKSFIDDIPDDYNVYYTYDNILYYDILKSNRKLSITHLLYLTTHFVESYIIPLDNVLKSKKRCNINILEVFNNNNIDYRNIRTFTETNIKYIRPIYDNMTSFGKNKIYCSIGSILNNDVFTYEETDLLYKKYFYNKYCYGLGITFNDVKKYWNRNVVTETFKNLAYKYNKSYPINIIDDAISFNENIKKIYYHNKKLKTIIHNVEIANKNKVKAITNILNIVHNINNVNEWRENNQLIEHSYYKDYDIPKTIYDNLNCFKINTIDNSIIPVYFDYVNIRLDNNIISFSNGISDKITLDDFIVWYNTICDYITKDTICLDKSTLDYVYLGSNLLHVIELDNRYDMDYPANTNKTYVFEFTKFTLWLTDIIDFIKYYHLEDKMNIEKWQQ